VTTNGGDIDAVGLRSLLSVPEHQELSQLLKRVVEGLKKDQMLISKALYHGGGGGGGGSGVYKRRESNFKEKDVKQQVVADGLKSPRNSMNATSSSSSSSLFPSVDMHSFHRKSLPSKKVLFFLLFLLLFLELMRLMYVAYKIFYWRLSSFHIFN
jgi:hypothetical protein